MSFRIEKSNLPANYWELNIPKNQRDLIIKKIAVGLIGALNLAMLGGAVYFIITYCPISTQALLISPFIVGVLGALAYLKFPTCGINSMNYTQYSNPAVILGKVITYVFFGPYMYASKKCDWTAYHDPIVANKIAHDLDTNSFESLAEEYGKHFDNFAKYGMIPPEYKDALLNLYQEYKPAKNELQYYEKKNLLWHEEAVRLAELKENIENRWKDLRESIRPHLYFPVIPKHNFRSRFTPIRLKIYDFFLSPPFED